jgi:hypothetical protein
MSWKPEAQAEGVRVARLKWKAFSLSSRFGLPSKEILKQAEGVRIV